MMNVGDFVVQEELIPSCMRTAMRIGHAWELCVSNYDFLLRQTPVSFEVDGDELIDDESKMMTTPLDIH